MKLVSMGNKKKSYGSIRLAAEAANMKPITFYMRLRSGMSVKEAMKTPVRKYSKSA